MPSHSNHREIAVILVALIFGGAIGAFAQMGGLAAGDLGRDVDLRADEISFAIRDGVFTDLNARGEVHMALQDLNLFSDRLKYDPLSEHLVAEAVQSDKVRVESTEVNASGRKLTYIIPREEFILEGNLAEVRQPNSQMRGEKINFISAGEGKIQMTVASAPDVMKENLAGDPDSEMQNDYERSIARIQKELNVTEAEARRLMGDNVNPAQVEGLIDGQKKSAETSRDSRAGSGRVSSDNWDKAPGASSDGGLVAED